MLKQRFLLYRDLVDNEPHFRRMAPVSLCFHVGIVLLLIALNYYLNGTVFTIGGGGGGGGPEVTVALLPAGGLPVPAPTPPPPPDPTPAPKPEPKPKPKPEPPKPVEKKEPPKEHIDPEAVKEARPVEKKKPEEKKPEPEKKKPEPLKPEPPKKPVAKKDVPKKPEPEKKKEEPKNPNAKPTPPPAKPMLLAKNVGPNPGPAPLAGGGDTGEGAGLPGPGGASNFSGPFEGWGRSLYMQLHPLWSQAQPGGFRRDPSNYAEIEFTVDRNGNFLSEPKITKEALDPEIGQLGLQVLKTARRLPPFPTNITESSVTVVYRFVPPK